MNGHNEFGQHVGTSKLLCDEDAKRRSASQTLYHDSQLQLHPMSLLAPSLSSKSEVRFSTISLVQPELNKGTKNVANLCSQLSYDSRCSSLSTNERFKQLLFRIELYFFIKLKIGNHHEFEIVSSCVILYNTLSI